ncbi:glycerol-3-phosphate responsive antiterminator [Bacillus kwashiorkori]|uniref:glycerol-3-phosphate responsive antiterminator n=1 Tax=Bacillus kwashiorkori TaxID=1522318 RepID=UPI00078545F4|nr:glycerol-3-phosphate responsive antiterminator [Bacillus kwashiorkori]
MTEIIDMVESQIIASIKRPEDFEQALTSEVNIVFLMTGDLLTIKEYVDILKDKGKYVFLHLDFIEGLANNKSAIKFVAQHWKPTGIITTKSNLIKYAKDEGLVTIQRMFLIDNGALAKGVEVINSCRPDAVEVLPGLMPKIIDRLTREIPMPLIVGGLISSKEEILAALEAGALAVSSGNPTLWKVNI